MRFSRFSTVLTSSSPGEDTFRFAHLTFQELFFFFFSGCRFKVKKKPLVLGFYENKCLGEVMLYLDVCGYQKNQKKTHVGKGAAT